MYEIFLIKIFLTEHISIKMISFRMPGPNESKSNTEQQDPSYLSQRISFIIATSNENRN